MNPDEHTRLANEALQLNKGWLLAAAVIGAGDRMIPMDFIIPNFLILEDKPLKSYVENLQKSFETIAEQIISDWNRSKLPSTTAWFAEKFDAWEKTEFGLFDMGRVHEVEQAIGRLGKHREIMDLPPYAQVILHGFDLGAAFRHPEYHLGIDLALLFNLFLDAEAMLEEAKHANESCNSEHSQSLARSVILTCFNLLESFVSGVAMAYLMENPNVPEATAKKLQDKNLSLRKRFILFPSLITGRASSLDDTCDPLKSLFGECKERRDSFVHCEPGPTPTKWGYVREQHFHDVDAKVVQRTVDLTYEAICLAWKVIHGREKPSWLPKRGSNGRFERVRVGLRALEDNSL